MLSTMCFCLKLLQIFILFHLGCCLFSTTYAVLAKFDDDDDLPPAPCFEPDRVALLGFKAGIMKDTTHFLDSWNGLNCCDWDGIVCDANRSVIRLTLQGPYASNNVYMTGTLSSSLGNLQNLQALLITGMKRIRGIIPESLSNLDNLTLLVLEDNGLQGQIPSSLGKLASLQMLSLMGNHLTGQIPPALGNMRNLIQISLARNFLSGSIPPSFKNLIKLQLLELSQNALSGSIPDFLGGIQDLDYLSLSNNQISGAIPISLCNSIKLSHLLLDGNRLSGTIPVQIGQMKSLSSLSLAVNKLTGSIPDSISKLPMLWSLNLSRNALSNRLPLSFPSSSLPQLLEIDLSYNNLNLETIPEWIKNKQVTKINLAGCKLRGSIPRFSGSLTFIDLSDNYFTDGISNLFVNMTGLETAKISNNQLKSDLSTIKLPKELVSIDLHSNQLYGSLSSLLNANTSNYLETIDVSNNQISGTIPETRGSYLNLKVFVISNNSISGQIPSSISNIINLEKLDISRNQIRGTIPPAIGMLHGLKWLDISRNGIIGKIPDSMLKIQGLRHANFKVNKLCGVIPQGRPLNAFKANAYLHNLCLCGKPLPPCKGKQ